jgi:Pentapeptide repeats (8 copies)
MRGQPSSRAWPVCSSSLAPLRHGGSSRSAGAATAQSGGESQELHLSREGQITDRFTKAIDQLDYEKSLEVRLGAIYALERIARDSERDHWPIMEVLTAYVRQHAAWKEEPQEEKQEGQFKPPAPDIRAILTVLGRRTRRAEDEPLDLRATDLRLAHLVGAHLEGAILWGAHLESAHLGGAHLQGANLVYAHLELVHLGGAHLQGAHLRGAHLHGAGLKGANLEGAHLQGTNLVGAHLEGANLVGAHLEGAPLEGAHLEGADLRSAVALTNEQIESAITDGNTKLPDYLAPHARPT